MYPSKRFCYLDTHKQYYDHSFDLFYQQCQIYDHHTKKRQDVDRNLVDEDIANNSVPLSQCTKFCKEHSLVISNLRLEIRSSRSSTFTSYAQGELSAVIPRQTSKCLLSGWKWYRGIKKWKQLSYCHAFEENRNEEGSYLVLRREVN